MTRKAGDARRSLAEILGLSLIAAFAAAGAAQAQTKGGPTPSAPGAAVHFVDIKDGAMLPTKPTINFGLRNMGVAPAGLDRENSGHHHLIIDMPTPSLDRPLPNDFNPCSPRLPTITRSAVSDAVASTSTARPGLSVSSVAYTA